jgi:hypothetical protein
MQIESYNTLQEIERFQEDWARLSAQEIHFVPCFSELRHQLSRAGIEFRVLVARDNGEVKAIACFLYRSARKRYEIATRNLFAFPVKTVSLFGSCVLGSPSEEVIRKFFQVILESSSFDVIDIGVIFIDSPMYKALKSLRGVVAWSVMRKAQTQWMIKLPDSIDAYLDSLRPTTKMRIKRDGRLFKRENPEYRVYQRPEDVEPFLRDAEEVSRLTYQWNLGYRVRNDEGTRLTLTRYAKQGTFRGYLVYARGKPCAFGWGELAHGTFLFRVTGYDPKYHKISPGTALIMHMVRDLIENTNCKIFDFGGGSEMGYKSRLGNLGLACARMQAAQIYRPFPFFLFALDQTFHLTKNSIMDTMEWVAGRGRLGRRLKGLLRPYGIGSY